MAMQGERCNRCVFNKSSNSEVVQCMQPRDTVPG